MRSNHTLSLSLLKATAPMTGLKGKQKLASALRPGASEALQLVGAGAFVANSSHRTRASAREPPRLVTLTLIQFR